MRFQRSVYLAVALAMAALLLSLPGCHKNSDWAGEPYEQKRVERQSDAGASHVAVLAVAPWEEYVESLQPNFKIEADKALAVVDTVSAVTQHRQMAGNQARLKLALSAGSQEPGDASKAPDSQGIGPFSLDQTPAPSIPQAGLSVDPATRYRSATALIQRVQILNRYLRDAVRRKGYSPYMVVLQISLMPRARNMPYDAYTTISFFHEDGTLEKYSVKNNPCACKKPEPEKKPCEPNCWKKCSEWAELKGCGATGCKMPVVVPLLATDSLEVALADRGQEFLSGLSLGLSASIKGIGASAGLESLLKKIRASTSKDLNSLFSVAQVSDNTLRVRMGAYHQGPDAYTMVPRTHNVSVLLLIPDTYFKDTGAEIRLRSITEFMDASTGEVLKERSSGERAAAWDALVKGSGVSEACLKKLAEAVFLNNRTMYMELIKDVVDPKMVDVIWLRIVQLRCGAQSGILSFEVPCPPPPATAWLEDDGQETTVNLFHRKLGEVQNCAADISEIRHGTASVHNPPVLLIRTQNRALRLPSNRPPLFHKNNAMTLYFKSLKALGLASGELKDNLVLRLSWQEKGKDNKLHTRHLDYNCYYRPVPAPAATLSIKESSKVIIASGGRGDLALDYELKGDAKKGRISLKGGSIDIGKSKAGKGATITNGSTLTVTKTGSSYLRLINLDPAQKVVLTPAGENNKSGALVLEVKEAGKGKQSSAETPEAKPGQTEAAK